MSGSAVPKREAPYDLVVIGGGSAGLVASDFAARLGARVALIEAHRIGGDCTWTGCVPSKALLRAARAAHEVRTAGRFGIVAPSAQVDMGRVVAHVRRAVQAVYTMETPDVLAERGIEVFIGHTEFADATAVRVGERTLHARRFLITTGAGAAVPPIPGLADVPFLTYENIFENERLPAHLLVIGAGPVGLELALAHQRLGAAVTVVAEELLPQEEREVRDFVQALLADEGIRLVRATVAAARRAAGAIALDTSAGEFRGDLLLVATGRTPNVEGLCLERAGISFDRSGIAVNRFLRTAARHIFAAGDVTGGPQFTHYAAWQAFQAARNALLPGRSAGTTALVPRVTFLDPEVAHVGLGEAEARARYEDDVCVHRRPMAAVDRAIADDETRGYLKIVARRNGRLLGATAIASHAGELIGELALALRHRLSLDDVAATIHAYPTRTTATQQLAADAAVDRFRAGLMGRAVLGLARLGR